MQTHLFELLTKTFAFAIDVKAATDQFVDQTKHFDRNLKMKFSNRHAPTDLANSISADQSQQQFAGTQPIG